MKMLQTIRLGEIISIQKIKNSKELPYVGMEDIESNSGIFIGSVEPKSVKSSTFHFSNEHLLYGRLRPYLNKILLPDFEGHCSTEIFPLKVNNDLSRKYLFYWLTSEEIVKRINKTCTGTRMPRANMKEVMSFEIPFPPLSEQRRIVKILDEVFEEVGKAKENAEKNLRNSRELFESYLQRVFENRGEGWEEKRLGEICENMDSKRIPTTRRDRVSGEYPYYGASGIVDYVNEYIFDEDLLLVSEDGANLLARTYPIAFSVNGKIWVNNHAHVLRFKQKATQLFLEYYLNSISLADYVNGMAQPKLNQKFLNSIIIPFPSLDEQKAIVRKLDALSEETKKLEENYRKEIEDLEELKKSVLQKAFRGEL